MNASAITARHAIAGRQLDRALALTLAFLIAEGSVMYTCYWSGHTEGIRVSDGMLTDLEYTLNGLHTVISFFLILSSVGLWIRRDWGHIVSSLALVSVLVTYGYWHSMTVKYLSELQGNNQLYRRVQQEVGWFHGATKWDFLVLALILLLLLWHLVKLIKMGLERRRNPAMT